MKEKDFEKCLDNLIIDGLIKESEQDNAEFEAAVRNMSDEDFLQLIGTSKSKQSQWKLWVGAIASVAAILLIVLIPTIHNMDSKICQSALIASSSYMTPSRGGNDMDFASLPKDKVRSMIPKLQEQYELLEPAEEIYVLDEPEEVSGVEYYIEATDQKEAGMQLVQAYLRTNQKAKAVELLHELADKYADSDFGDHCKKLLEILE